MNCARKTVSHQAAGELGMTLFEMMISSTIGLLVLAVVAALYLFGLRSFGAMSNYSDMDGKSRRTMDCMLKEIRQASKVVAFQTNGTAPYLTVECSIVSPKAISTFCWSTNTLTWDKWTGTTHTTTTLLTGCDSWSFAMYIRAPNTNGAFLPTADPAQCKLINMSWKCSRNNLVAKINTESMVTAEVVLRNLQE